MGPLRPVWACAIALLLWPGISRADWLIQTYMNGSSVPNLSAADALIGGSTPIASGYIDRSDLLGFNSGEGTGHFSLNYPVPGISPGHATDNYAVRGSGYVFVPSTGTYTFGMNTDDGAGLRIDGAKIIVDDVRQAPHDSAYITLNLTSGYHPIEWTWYNTAGGASGGGAEGEVFAAQGAYSSFNSNFKLIGKGQDAFLPISQVKLPTGPAPQRPITLLTPNFSTGDVDFAFPIRSNNQVTLNTEAGTGISAAASPAPAYYDPAHDGNYCLDFDVEGKGNVVAAKDGTIVYIRPTRVDNGPVVIIDHGNGYYSQYREFTLDPNLTLVLCHP